MRYGEITCNNCNNFFTFESLRDNINCISCGESHNITQFPELEITKEKTEQELKKEIVIRLIDLGELWLTSVDIDNIPLSYLETLEQTLLAKVDQDNQIEGE